MSLIIDKGVANELCVTLSELMDEDIAQNWLFVFTKLSGNTIYKTFLTDETDFPGRYNLFTLTEGSEVTFSETGQYKYEVYQMPDTDDTDQTRGVFVESGKLTVNKATIVRPTKSADKTRVSYERGS